TADNIYPAFVWVYFGHQPAALEFPPAGGNKGIPARFAEHQSLGQEVGVFERFDEDLCIPGFQSSLIFDGDDARNRTPFLANTNLFQRNPLQHAASLRSSRWYGGQGGGMPPFRPAEPSPRLNCTTLYHEEGKYRRPFQSSSSSIRSSWRRMYSRHASRLSNSLASTARCLPRSW